MALAGSLKLSTFGIIAVVVVGGGIAGSCVACRHHEEHEHEREHEKDREREAANAATPTPAPAPAPAPPPLPVTPPPAEKPAPPPTTPSDLAARTFDPDVVAWRTKHITGDHQKDVAHGAAYKLDVYEDSGKSTVNRAKLDIQRNGRWDDKYTFDGSDASSTITLEHAPNDDEKYDRYHWNGGGWTRAN